MSDFGSDAGNVCLQRAAQGVVRQHRSMGSFQILVRMIVQCADDPALNLKGADV
jgi:hypothetical protein